MVVWICGKSGSGKTTIGRSLFSTLKERLPNLFLLDGDDFREAMGGEVGYTPEERAMNANRIARFCCLLDSQNIHVICCAVTITPELQAINRERISGGYCEVYLDVSLDTLVRRDPKSLYARCLCGEIKNVPGVDIEYHPPGSPHLVFDNNKDEPSIDHFVWKIIDLAFASERHKKTSSQLQVPIDE